VFRNFLSFQMKPATIAPHRQFVGEKLTFLVAETTVYGACFYMFSWCFAIINMQNNYFFIYTKIYFFVINSAALCVQSIKKKPGEAKGKPQIIFSIFSDIGKCSYDKHTTNYQQIIWSWFTVRWL
jgi:hypothetical protein